MRLLILLAILLTGFTAPASAERSYFMVQARDIQATERWYRRVFQLRATNSFDRPAFVQRVLMGPELILELAQRRDPPPPADGPRQGLMKVGLQVRDFDRRLSRLRAEGLAPPGGVFFDESLGLATVLLRDPDGNIVQLFGKSRGPFAARVAVSPDFRPDPK